MRKYQPTLFGGSQLLRRRFLRFAAIITFAVLLIAFVVITTGSDALPYSATDLRATAAALDIRATEIAQSAISVGAEDAARGTRGDGTSTVSAAPVRDATGSRISPVPYGTAFYTTDQLEIRILSADFDAWSQVAATNQFNDAPLAGNRMILVQLEVTNLSPAYRDEPRSISSSDFRLTGSYGVVYAPFETMVRCGVIPDELDWEIFTGATVSGNFCVQAPEDETDFLLVYLSGHDWQKDAAYFNLVDLAAPEK